MSWTDTLRRHLPEHLDAHGDLPPPWAEFPTYERYSIGWRMGSGEFWLGLMHAFLADMPTDYATRAAYLRRHPPAPPNWSEYVYRLLHPEWAGDPDDDDEDDDEDDDGPYPDDIRRAQLKAGGFIASDAAYAIWRAKQQDVRWPWLDTSSPTAAGRHWTRDLWFWSRHVAELRAAGRLEIPRVPWRWRGCVAPLKAGHVERIEPRRGLITLVRMLCAGEVVPPWRLGLAVTDFADTFADDMGYVDAYRLWGMSVIDDAEMRVRFCEPVQAPEEWKAWLDAQLYLG